MQALQSRAEGAERQLRDEKREASEARTSAGAARQALEELRQAYSVLQVRLPGQVIHLTELILLCAPVLLHNGLTLGNSCHCCHSRCI
jgi:hypothetical protein